MKLKPFATLESIFAFAQENPGANRTGGYAAGASLVLVFVGFSLGLAEKTWTTTIVMLLIAGITYLYGVRTLYHGFDPRTREFNIAISEAEAVVPNYDDDDTAEMPVITADQVLDHTRANALRSLKLSRDGRMNLAETRSNLIAMINAIDNHNMMVSN